MVNYTVLFPSPNKGIYHLFTPPSSRFFALLPLLQVALRMWTQPVFCAQLLTMRRRFRDTMRTFNNVTLLAVLSYVAMIGATPLGNRAQAPATQALDRRGMYVPFKKQF